MESKIAGRDVYMRHTGGDGKTYVAFHRVWNADLFVTARQAEASQLALKEIDEKKKAGLHKSERITEAEYLAERIK